MKYCNTIKMDSVKLYVLIWEIFILNQKARFQQCMKCFNCFIYGDIHIIFFLQQVTRNNYQWVTFGERDKEEKWIVFLFYTFSNIVYVLLFIKVSTGVATQWVIFFLFHTLLYNINKRLPLKCQRKKDYINGIEWAFFPPPRQMIPQMRTLWGSCWSTARRNHTVLNLYCCHGWLWGFPICVFGTQGSLFVS